MNLPINPFHKRRGKNGASVVNVPANTGSHTSPAASFAERTIGTLPLLYILCVFSITTMASSTIIPKPKSNAKRTMKLSVTELPITKSATGKKRKATN